MERVDRRRERRSQHGFGRDGDPAGGGRSGPRRGGVEPRTRPAACPLLAHLRPGDGCIALLPRSQRSQAALEVLEALEQLGLAVGVQKNAAEPAALEDVEGLLTLLERVELAAKPRSEILGGDDPGQQDSSYDELYD